MIARRSFSANECVESDDEKSRLNELYPSLQKYSRFLAQNKWDAEDLVQEAFVKALQYYRPSEISAALLNKIAYHHWIDIIRKRKHETIGVLEDVLEREHASIPDGLLDTVELLMNNLTPKQAVIFALKEAFGYQTREIADLLETTEMAVKSSLHRAKKRFEKETPLQVVDSYWSGEDRELLHDLFYISLQAEDPAILIDSISKIPSLAEVPKLAKQKYSALPLNLSCMAA
ncbi:sigma-70 family RNA polymerase sigma factor [Priestia abyssalis]|uniref:sigma-70 family RNA polymerase sigma factor n=1 Tax=Priestia abyssalis TaxID=1221450 RepID=UPI000995937C|nr:sigma-70 family RNA polymerase sigma factor [Priestia abyssalis]